MEASLARGHVLNLLDGVAHRNPKGEALDQRARLDPPELALKCPPTGYDGSRAAMPRAVRTRPAELAAEAQEALIECPAFLGSGK